MEKSKRFIGVYLNRLKDGDITYYISYKNNENKKQWLKIGKKKRRCIRNFLL